MSDVAHPHGVGRALDKALTTYNVSLSYSNAKNGTEANMDTSVAICSPRGYKLGTVRTPGIGLNLRPHDGEKTANNALLPGPTPGDEGSGVAPGKSSAGDTSKN